MKLFTNKYLITTPPLLSIQTLVSLRFDSENGNANTILCHGFNSDAEKRSLRCETIDCALKMVHAWCKQPN